MAIEFEPMSEERLDEALRVYNHYVERSTATFHSEALGRDEMRGILFPNYPRFGSWAVFLDGAFAGYAILARYKPRQAYDETAELTIYLDTAFTGRGLGRACLEFLEARARERGFHALLAIICAENEASIRLFKGAGYEECARYREVGRKFDRLLDVVSYEKILGP